MRLSPPTDPVVPQARRRVLVPQARRGAVTCALPDRPRLTGAAPGRAFSAAPAPGGAENRLGSEVFDALQTCDRRKASTAIHRSFRRAEIEA